jgi:hypothetical protein
LHKRQSGVVGNRQFCQLRPASKTGERSVATSATRDKPRQSFAGLWNISFGFFGIQIGFALQN